MDVVWRDEGFIFNNGDFVAGAQGLLHVVSEEGFGVIGEGKGFSVLADWVDVVKPKLWSDMDIMVLLLTY